MKVPLEPGLEFARDIASHPGHPFGDVDGEDLTESALIEPPKMASADVDQLGPGEIRSEEPDFETNDTDD